MATGSGSGAAVGPADERRHPPGPDPDWEESWQFDFAAHDGSLGGFVRLTLRPGDGTAWYWAYLAGPRRPVVVVRDHEVEPPRSRTLEVRGPGLWAQVICETPFDHWSVGLEAGGVALDDPSEGLRGELGQPIPMGLDMEWEATGEPAGDAAGYVVPAIVNGDLLLGADRWELDALAWWSHRWGRPPWREEGWWWAAGTIADRTSVAAGAPGRGWSWTGRGHPRPAPLDPDVSLSPERLTGGGLDITLSPVAWAFVPLPGGRALARSLCSWSRAQERGWGWCERLQTPAP
jgi:hypothetical protein